MRHPFRSCLLLLALSAAACGPEAEPSADSAQASLEALGTDAGSGAGTSKVSVCHLPPGNPANAHTLVVGAPAVDAHLRHGDTLGACGAADGGSADGGAGDAGADAGACLPSGASCAEGGLCCEGLTCSGEGRCVTQIN